MLDHKKGDEEGLLSEDGEEAMLNLELFIKKNYNLQHLDFSYC
jgi:hypothetical protein